MAKYLKRNRLRGQKHFHNALISENLNHCFRVYNAQFSFTFWVRWCPMYFSNFEVLEWSVIKCILKCKITLADSATGQVNSQLMIENKIQILQKPTVYQYLSGRTSAWASYNISLYYCQDTKLVQFDFMFCRGCFNFPSVLHVNVKQSRASFRTGDRWRFLMSHSVYWRTSSSRVCYGSVETGSTFIQLGRRLICSTSHFISNGFYFEI